MRRLEHRKHCGCNQVAYDAKTCRPGICISHIIEKDKRPIPVPKHEPTLDFNWEESPNYIEMEECASWNLIPWLSNFEPIEDEV